MPLPIDQTFDESFEIGNTAPVERSSLAEDRSDFGELADHSASLEDLSVESVVASSDARDITASFLVESADGAKKTKKWCDHCQVNHFSTTVCPYLEHQKKEKGEGSTAPKLDEATAPSKAQKPTPAGDVPEQAAGKGAKPNVNQMTEALANVPVSGWSETIGAAFAGDILFAMGQGNLVNESSLSYMLSSVWPDSDISAGLKALKDKGYFQQQGDELLLTLPNSTGEAGQTATTPAPSAAKLTPDVLSAALASSGLQPGMAESMSKVLLKQFTSKSPDGIGVSIPLKKLVTTLVEAHGWQPTPTAQGLQALMSAGVLIDDGAGGVRLSAPAEIAAAVGGVKSGKPLPQKADGGSLAKSMGLHVKSLGYQTLALLGEKGEPLDLKQVYDTLGLQGKFEGFVKPKLVPLLTHLVEEGKLQKIDVPGGEPKYFFGSFEQPITEEEPPAEETTPAPAPGAVEEAMEALPQTPEPEAIEEPATGQPGAEEGPKEDLQPTGVCPDGHDTYLSPVPHNCPQCGKVMLGADDGGSTEAPADTSGGAVDPSAPLVWGPGTFGKVEKAIATLTGQDPEDVAQLASEIYNAIFDNPTPPTVGSVSKELEANWPEAGKIVEYLFSKGVFSPDGSPVPTPPPEPEQGTAAPGKPAAGATVSAIDQATAQKLFGSIYTNAAVAAKLAPALVDVIGGYYSSYSEAASSLAVQSGISLQTCTDELVTLEQEGLIKLENGILVYVPEPVQDNAPATGGTAETAAETVGVYKDYLGTVGSAVVANNANTIADVLQKLYDNGEGTNMWDAAEVIMELQSAGMAGNDAKASLKALLDAGVIKPDGIDTDLLSLAVSVDKIKAKKEQPVVPGTTLPQALVDKLDALPDSPPGVAIASAVQGMQGTSYAESKMMLQKAFEAAGHKKPEGMQLIDLMDAMINADIISVKVDSSSSPSYTINPALAALPTGKCPVGHNTYKVPVPHNCPTCGAVMAPNPGYAVATAPGDMASPSNPKPIQDALKGSMGNAASKAFAKALCEALAPGTGQDVGQIIEAVSEATGIEEEDIVSSIEELIAAGVIKESPSGGIEWLEAPKSSPTNDPSAFNPTPIAKALDQLAINPGGKSITFLKTLNSKGADGLSMAEAMATMPDPPSGTPKINASEAYALIVKGLEKGLITKVPNTAPQKYIFGNVGGPVEDKRVKSWTDALKALGVDTTAYTNEIASALIKPDGTLDEAGAKEVFKNDYSKQMVVMHLTNKLLAAGVAEYVELPDGTKQIKLKGYAPPPAFSGPPVPLPGSSVPKAKVQQTFIPIVPKEIKLTAGAPKQRPEPPNSPAPDGVTTTAHEAAWALGFDLHDPADAAKWDVSQEKKLIDSLDTHARLGSHFPTDARPALQKLLAAGVLSCTKPDALYSVDTWAWREVSFMKKPLRRAMDSAVGLPPATEVRYTTNSSSGEVERELIMAPEVADSIKAFREFMPALGESGEKILAIMTTDPGKRWSFDEIADATGLSWTGVRKALRGISLNLIQQMGQGAARLDGAGDANGDDNSYGLFITGSDYGGRQIKLNLPVLLAASTIGQPCQHCRVKHRPTTKCPWVGHKVSYVELDNYMSKTALPGPLPAPAKAPPQAGPGGAPLSVQAALSKLGFNSGTLGHLVISSLQNPTDLATLKAVVAQKYQKWGPEATIKKAVQAGVLEVLPDGKYALKGTGAKLASAGLGTTTILPTPGKMSAPIPDASPQPLPGADEIRLMYAVDHPIQRMPEDAALRFHQLMDHMQKGVMEHPEFQGTAPAFRSTKLALDVASQLMSPMARAIALSWAYQWKSSSDSWGGRVMGATVNQIGMNSSPTATSMGVMQAAGLTFEKEALLTSHGLDPKKYGNESVRDVDLFFDATDPDAPSVIGIDQSETSSITSVAALLGVSVSDIKPSARKKMNYGTGLLETIPTWTCKGPSRKEVLLQQYAATQTAMRLSQEQSTTCFRGMHDTPPYNVVQTMMNEAKKEKTGEGRGAKVFMNPVASWSASAAVATQAGFGYFNGDSTDPTNEAIKGMGLAKDTPPYLMLYHYEQQIQSPIPSIGKDSVMMSGEDEIVMLGHQATTVTPVARARFAKISQMLSAGGNPHFASPTPDPSVPTGFGIYVMTPDYRLFWVTAEEVIPCAQDFGKRVRKPSTPRPAHLSVSGAYDRTEAHA